MSEFMRHMGFLRTDLLIWSVGLLLLAWFLGDLRRRKVLRLSAFGAGGGQIRGVFRFFLPLLIAALIFLSLIRPYTGYQEFKVSTQGASVLAVLDISLSMLTEDVSPSRLEAAKRKLEDLISLLQERKAGERLGIVVFAGGNYVLCPLTSDYAILRMYVRAISTDLISSEGSGLNAALQTAVESLGDARTGAAVVILLSDGEDNYFNPSKAAAALAGLQGKLHSIGFGTTEGRPINAANGRFITDLKGNIVISRLSEEILSTVADTGRGSYQRAALDDSDLRAILPSSGVASGKEDQDSQTIRVYQEVGPILLMLVLVAICLAFARGKPDLLFPAILLLFFSQELHAQEPPSLFESYRAYQDEDFEKARAGFEAYSQKDPTDSDVLQALGSSLYRLGRHEEAARVFEKAAEQARSASGRQRFENLFNGGNSDFMAGKFEDAVSKYEEALRLKDKDPETLHNLELARKRMEQKQKQQERQDQKEEQKQQEEENQEQSQAENTPSEDPKDKKEQEQSGEEEQKQSKPGEQEGQQQQQAQAEGTRKPGSNMETPDAPQDSSSEETEEDKSSEQHPGETQKDEKELKASEARQWLESLDDSPLLLNQKKQSKEQVNPQSW